MHEVKYAFDLSIAMQFGINLHNFIYLKVEKAICICNSMVCCGINSTSNAGSNGAECNSLPYNPKYHSKPCYHLLYSFHYGIRITTASRRRA